MLMDRKTYFLVAGIIFTLVALFHLLRIFEDWPVMIVDWSVPKWMSWVGLIVPGGLAIFGFQFTANEPNPLTTHCPKTLRPRAIERCLSEKARHSPLCVPKTSSGTPTAYRATAIENPCSLKNFP